MSFISKEVLLKKFEIECLNCKKSFIFNEIPSEEYFNKIHYKECVCKHSFSEWYDINLGTWPDVEISTSRYCKLCGKGESL